MEQKYDPFKMGVAQTLKELKEGQHHLYAQSEMIRERVYRKERHVVPDLNVLYDSQRTPNAWRYTADLSIPILNQSVVAGVNTITIVTPTGQPPNWRLSQWPNGIQLYMVVSGYGFSQRAAVGTIGTIIHQFQPNAGPAVCIAMSQTNSPGIDFVGDVLVPFPVVDPSNPTIGNLILTLSPGGASTITADMFINISAAYLLPSYMAYKLREEFPEFTREVHDNAHHHSRGNN